jgi:tripartite-type tricarboxylate transporter receptor subunit TctC
MIGTGMVANAPADGYTLLMASNGNMTVTPLVMKNLTYDPIKALRVIAIVGEIPTVAVTNLQTPVTDLRAFAAYAKANDGKAQLRLAGARQRALSDCSQTRERVGHPNDRSTLQRQCSIAHGPDGQRCSILC